MPKKKKEKYKRPSFGHAWNTHANHVSKFQLPIKKKRAGNRIFRFGLKPWVQGGVEYIGNEGLRDRTVVAAAGRLAAMLCSSFVSVSGASASASASVSVRF